MLGQITGWTLPEQRRTSSVHRRVKNCDLSDTAWVELRGTLQEMSPSAQFSHPPAGPTDASKRALFTARVARLSEVDGPGGGAAGGPGGGSVDTGGYSVKISGWESSSHCGITF